MSARVKWLAGVVVAFVLGGAVGWWMNRPPPFNPNEFLGGYTFETKGTSIYRFNSLTGSMELFTMVDNKMLWIDLVKVAEKR